MDESLRQLTIKVRVILSGGRFQRAACNFFYVYIAVAVVIGAVQPFLRFFTTRNIKETSIDEVRSDHDYRNPLYQLAHHPHFRDTFIWWTRNWIGEYRNWRPLASQFFWFEYKLFGPYRFDEYSVVAIVSHLLALLTLAWFVKTLTGSRPVAGLSVLLFAGSGSVFPLNVFHGALGSQYIPPASVCLGKWKDTVDFWYCACLFASSALALKGRWGPSLILAFMSPCFKETGWMVFPANLLLVGLQGRIREIPRWVWVATLACIGVLLVFRVMAGTDIMGAYTEGHNISWATRYGDAVSGAFVKVLPTRPAVALFAVGIVPIAVRPKMRFVYKFCAAIALIAVCAVVDMVTFSHDLIQFWAIFFDWRSGLNIIVACTLWAYGCYALIADRELRRYVPLLLLFRLVSAATLVITLAIGAHVLYLSEAYAAILAALAVVAVGRRLFGPIGAWLDGPQAKADPEGAMPVAVQ